MAKEDNRANKDKTPKVPPAKSSKAAKGKSVDPLKSKRDKSSDDQR